MTSRFDASKFTTGQARPLPIILLLDCSGSMSGDKIASLNLAVRKMLNTLSKEESRVSEFLVAIITFGGDARIAIPPTSASKITYADLHASGLTPLGAALDLAKNLIEDKTATPSRAFRPLMVLVSDGIPTDTWEPKLDDLVLSGRSSKCDRMAMGIGPEAYEGEGRKTLDRFISGTDHKVFEADEAEKIQSFFKLVTMSTVSRSKSIDPNVVPADSELEARKPAGERQRDAFW